MVAVWSSRAMTDALPIRNSSAFTQPTLNNRQQAIEFAQVFDACTFRGRIIQCLLVCL
jgi:hypothetical protein